MTRLSKTPRWPVLCLAWLALAPAPASAQAAPRADEIIQRAATALGGATSLRALRSLELQGYGQTAYMWGGGNITGDESAPQKWQANTTLRYRWDLDHDRYQSQWRSNFLFPFAAAFGHSFRLDTRGLDGEVAFDTAEDGGHTRVGESNPGPLETDGAYDRRMWSLTNPAIAVRAALTGEASVSNPRQSGAEDLVDLTVDAGTLTLAVDHDTGRPRSIAWSTAQSNLGQVKYTTAFTGYAPYGDLTLPLGFRTTLDWRGVVYRTVFVDGYVINGDVGDLAAPAEIRAAPLPSSLPALVAEPVAEHIWRISNGTTVIEFADHLAIFELGDNQAVAKAVLAVAQSLRPDKPVTELIVSHHHFDHTAGLRVAVAAGLTVISRRENEAILREVVARPASDFADALPQGGVLKFKPVDGVLSVGDATTQLVLYPVVSNSHMADALFAYAPQSKTMIEGDIGTAAEDWQFWPDSYLDNLDAYGLTVDRISPVHLRVFTHLEMIEFIRQGARRAQDRCATFAAAGDPLPGCPPFSHRSW